MKRSIRIHMNQQYMHELYRGQRKSKERLKREDRRHKAILHRWRHQQRDEQPLRTYEITLIID